MGRRPARPTGTHIRLPYDERAPFHEFHRRKQRWACLVAHRRAGKTVAAVNDIIIRACMKSSPYAYFAPYRSQAKAVSWEYFKFYAAPLIKDANEAELRLELINKSTIQLFGADNADAARGMGFGGVYLDEYGDFRPSVWGNVIRPTLSDRKGWAVFGGTPKGHNQFYDIYRSAKERDDWFVLSLKASVSKILDNEELDAARAQLSEDQYQQEYECSFDAAIMGAFYGKEMALVDAEGRIGDVPYDPAYLVNTYWDVGYRDDTAIWFAQNVGNQLRILDCFAESGGSIEEFDSEKGDFRPGSLIKAVKDRPYRYGRHWLPHDAKAKTLGSDGKSVIEKIAKYVGIGSIGIVPNLSVEDGIQATRTMLRRCWFDRKCNQDSYSGVEALRQYQREYDEDKKSFRKIPLHNWCSHYADGARMMAVAERRSIPDDPVSAAKPFIEQFPSIERMSLDQLWEARDQQMSQRVRI